MPDAEASSGTGVSTGRRQVVYLGISGVLHPSQSLYELVLRRSPWDDGHARYEGVPVLAAALEPWPSARIVLTSTQPWAHGLASVLAHLGPLASRVAGFTFDDLTQNAVRVVRTRSGTTRMLTYSSNEYWRMNKSDIVAAHVAWSRPVAWIAIDDESILWPHDVMRDRLVLTDGCAGLLDAATQDRLLTVLAGNFGAAGQAPPHSGDVAPPLPHVPATDVEAIRPDESFGVAGRCESAGLESMEHLLAQDAIAGLEDALAGRFLSDEDAEALLRPEPGQHPD